MHIKVHHGYAGSLILARLTVLSLKLFPCFVAIGAVTLGPPVAFAAPEALLSINHLDFSFSRLGWRGSRHPTSFRLAFALSCLTFLTVLAAISFSFVIASLVVVSS